jgi:8-oxo-dGTP pyrophosphatase MutT (NUDIX family)
VILFSDPNWDGTSTPLPVSVKGVVIRSDRVVLLKNRRDEWELPGGRPEANEDLETALVREVREELGLEVEPVELVDAWLYTIAEDDRVLIVAYGCIEREQRAAVLSDEHTELAWIALTDVGDLRMPDKYKRSITLWTSHVGGGATTRLH